MEDGGGGSTDGDDGRANSIESSKSKVQTAASITNDAGVINLEGARGSRSEVHDNNYIGEEGGSNPFLSSNVRTVTATNGKKRKERGEEGRENESINRGKVTEVYGLFIHSDVNITSITNRDYNAPENQSQDIMFWINFGRAAYEFRENVMLRGNSAYEPMRRPVYEAKRVNVEGQIIKFRKKKKTPLVTKSG